MRRVNGIADLLDVWGSEPVVGSPVSDGGDITGSSRAIGGGGAIGTAIVARRDADVNPPAAARLALPPVTSPSGSVREHHEPVVATRPR